MISQLIDELESKARRGEISDYSLNASFNQTDNYTVCEYRITETQSNINECKIDTNHKQDNVGIRRPAPPSPPPNLQP